MRLPDWLRCPRGLGLNLPNHTRPDRGLTRYGKITIASVDYVSPTAELDRDSTSKKSRIFSIVIVFANCCLLVVSAAGCFALFVTGIFWLHWSGLEQAEKKPHIQL